MKYRRSFFFLGTGSKRWPQASDRCNSCRLADSLLVGRGVDDVAAPQPAAAAAAAAAAVSIGEPVIKDAGAKDSTPASSCRCLAHLQQVQHLLRYGRPVWDEVPPVFPYSFIPFFF